MATKPRARQAVVREWLKRIVATLPVTMGVDEMNARTRSYTPFLAAKFPEEAFCEGSFKAVVENQTYFPSVEEIEKKIEAWMKEIGIGEPAELPGGDDPTLTREDRIKLNVWSKHRGEGFGHINGDMAVSLSVCRKYWPRVYSHLIRTDTECAAIAVRKGWEREARVPPTEAEIAAVSATAARVVAELKAGPLYQKSGPLPDDGSAALPAGPTALERKFEAEHGRKIGGLSSEAIAAARDANPMIQNAREADRKIKAAREAEEIAARAVAKAEPKPRRFAWSDPP
jgi:hypothetical protein